MLGDRRLGQRKFSHYLTAHSCFFSRQHAENPHPGRVADGLSEFGEIFVGLRTFQSQQICLHKLLDFRAAESVQIKLFFLAIRRLTIAGYRIAVKPSGKR